MKEHMIWLQSAMGAGSVRAVRALEHFGSAEDVYRTLPSERAESRIFTAAELKRLCETDLSVSVKIAADCLKYGIEIITLEDKKYPHCLSVINDPPLVLYVKGEMPDFDDSPAVCIVGPRKVSEYGKKAAYSLAFRLSRAGITVVSGGAVGADYYAHAGALKAGGKTVLVMACGIESGYLMKNEALRRRTAESGCVLSEYPPETKATRFSFPVRNRIMSALASATAVVEAGNKSGALITAGHALEQGKDVFVIPGSPSAKEYEGSNALLRDGARPLLDASDIFNEYILRFPDKIDIKKAYEEHKKTPEKAQKTEVHKKLSNETLSKEAKIVYNHLDKHKFYPEEITGTGLDSQQVLAALTELEIELLIRALPGGCYELCGR